MSAPEVSIVIPTRDRAALLARTLGCALAQQDVDLEVVVVDDGSTDATPQVLAAVADPRLRLVRLEGPHGVAEARNRGIAVAAGQWIAFLDDDDLWAPDKLAQQLEAAESKDRRWVYAGAVAVDAALRILAGGPPPAPAGVVADLPFRNVVPAGSSNVVVRRDLLDESGGFDTQLRHMADWDLWIRFASRATPAVAAQPIVAYLLHPGNASLDQRGILAEMAVIEERHAGRRDGRPVDRAYVHRWMAWSALRRRDRWGAARAYGRAVAAGDGRSMARAAVGLVWPAVADRGLGRQRPVAAWNIAAERWLAEMSLG